MGIPGLTSFINKNFYGWERKSLKDYLVIDGYNLCYRLYTFEWNRGGEYPRYRARVLEFFNALLQSEIKPIVILDGIDYKQEKVATTMKRRQESIKYIHSHTGDLSPKLAGVYGNVLPVLAFEVFQLSLREVKVPCYVVDGEADKVLVQVANYFKCPVLSSDSDFFLYMIEGGYVPIDRFNWQSTPVTCEVFRVSRFVKQFGIKQDNLRFVIPALVGNDFLSSVTSERLISCMANAVGMSVLISHPIAQIVRCLSRYASMEKFIEQTKSLPNGHQVKVNCFESERMYTCEETTDPESLLASSVLCTLKGESIPDWVIDQYHKGSFNHHLMSVLVLGKSILRIIPDDSRKASSFNASLTIRQNTYYVLRIPDVTEFTRIGLDLSARRVKTLPFHDAPTLASVHLSSPLQRAQCACQILDCDPSLLSALSEEWKLVAAVTRFWANATDTPAHLVQALLYCNVVCFTCNSSLNEIRSMCKLSSGFVHSSKWMTALHAFSQWQCCYFDALSVNQSLLQPFVFVSPAYLYDGTIALFMAQDVASVPSNFPLDTKLCKALTELVLRDRFSAVPQSGKIDAEKKVSQKEIKCLPKSKKPVVSTFVHSNPFSLLQVDSDEECL